MEVRCKGKIQDGPEREIILVLWMMDASEETKHEAQAHPATMLVREVATSLCWEEWQESAVNGVAEREEIDPCGATTGAGKCGSEIGSKALCSPFMNSVHSFESLSKLLGAEAAKNDKAVHVSNTRWPADNNRRKGQMRKGYGTPRIE